MKKVTIVDVAAYAGSSMSTVSRVLSDSSYPVAAETRERILMAATELGYAKPSGSSRYGRKRNEKEIGVILPTILNPFYSMALTGLSSELRNWGYNILIYDSCRDPDNEIKLLRSLSQKGITGVILSSLQSDGEVLREFTSREMKIILLDQKVDNADCDHVLFEYKNGARQAVHYLHSIGHRDICFVTTPLTRWTRLETYSGYRQALIDCGIEYNADMLLISQVERESNDDIAYETRSGQLMAQEFLRRGAKGTAALCVNDMMAFGFIRELRTNNLRVPEDVSVIGFDDIPFAAMFSPSLTTVHCPAVESGRISAQMLRQKITGDIHAGFDMKLEAKLIKRDSTMPIG